MTETFQLMPLWAFLAAVAVTVGAGVVKGVVGFALPLIMVSGLSTFLPPELAIAGLLLPVVLSNLMQVMRHGMAEARDAVGEYWRYVLIVCVMILFVAQLVTRIPAQVFYLALGIPVVLLSLVQLFGVRFHVPPHRRHVTEWGVGTFAGALGGLSGTWGPPTVLLLIALETPKARQMVVQGVVYGLGAVSLLVGHLQSGVLNWTTAPFSAALLVPAVVGMRLGFWLGDRLDAVLFRRLTLVVLIVAGLNLIRRGLFG